VRVLFVCMGNICRSPTAEAVFRHMVAAGSLAGKVDIDSAGTHGYHEGAPPDARATEHAAKRGYDLTPLRARLVSPTDFERFDYVIAMDELNRRHLRSICPTRLQDKIELLLDYGGEADEAEVPDPYQGDARDFEVALDLIEAGCEGLHEYLHDQMRMRGAMSSGSGSLGSGSSGSSGKRD
jgi:protein-tyrosine phosphatase